MQGAFGEQEVVWRPYVPGLSEDGDATGLNTAGETVPAAATTGKATTPLCKSQLVASTLFASAETRPESGATIAHNGYMQRAGYSKNPRAKQLATI